MDTYSNWYDKDKIVKDFLKEQAGLSQSYSRYEPEHTLPKNVKKNFQIITKSALCPSKEEVDLNPRSRSAKMRVAIKL